MRSFPHGYGGVTRTAAGALTCALAGSGSAAATPAGCAVTIAHEDVSAARTDVVTLTASIDSFATVLAMPVFRPLVTIAVDRSALRRLGSAASCADATLESTALYVSATFPNPAQPDTDITVDVSSVANLTISDPAAVRVGGGRIQALVAPSEVSIALPFTAASLNKTASVRVLNETVCVDALKPVALSHADLTAVAVEDGLEVTVVLSQEFREPGDVAMTAVYAQVDAGPASEPVMLDVTGQV